MNKKARLAVIVLAALVVLGMAKNGLAQMMLAGGLSKAAHVPVSIGSTRLSFLKSSIMLKGLKLRNPGGFKDRMMADVPLVSISFDPPALFKGTAHFKDVQLDLKELTVIRNKDGKLNLDAVKPAAQEGKKSKAEGQKVKLHIDRLSLSIGRVVYKDYSAGGEPSVQVFDINIKDRQFQNIDNPAAVVSLIMFEALTRTTLSRLADLDLGLFKSGASGILDTSLGLVEGGANTIEGTAKGLLSIFK